MVAKVGIKVFSPKFSRPKKFYFQETKGEIMRKHPQKGHFRIKKEY